MNPQSRQLLTGLFRWFERGGFQWLSGCKAGLLKLGVFFAKIDRLDPDRRVSFGQ
jgi:hypothetical protein